MAVQKDKIIIRGLSKTFYQKNKVVEVLKNINITVKENEFLVLLGPGQCGKTVLLNIMADLDKPTEGEVEFTDGRPEMGNLGIVFQRYALFPWKTVMGNVEVNQKFKGTPKEKRQQAAQKYIELVGLQGFENALPQALSGGMQQRVGIARAYATESDIMLLDEPFGALDAQTRYSMEDEILRMWEQDKRTVIFVTNNVEEAIYLGDRIILLGGHPTGVKKEYVPEMPRPRNYTDVAFLKLRNEIVNNTDLVL
ncbi:ABC transporter ATP-binding protein [Acetanaerobacterium elongatum]|uniref:NitT/TauT family transport system ATP-binding protein/sulfonate transport system ATP-binding protein n=1 Tax=Acetanaerobacterium elongatum TaxID=258515 RepID=A0A1H0EG96_9FIRM|nr:ABC transporter ATP-binding protein [Acetanaerobacterium elongatum]SDN81382.1 NitT/TauT family transport system ATP-binding protein/sulfonate transport system ATP-binding protein [Acetanaerobacterium elongatum]